MASLHEMLRGAFGTSQRPTITYTPTYGYPQYQGALEDWQKAYGTYSKLLGGVTPQLSQMMKYYQPGGGYGQGMRQEAKETVQVGTAQDLASMVASGMASQFGTRGVQTRAGAELSKLYKNIEDTRAQLQMQAVTPYAQIMSQMANMMGARPTYGQYFQLGRAPSVTYPG
jgi:hypothetical protein